MRLLHHRARSRLLALACLTAVAVALASVARADEGGRNALLDPLPAAAGASGQPSPPAASASTGPAPNDSLPAVPGAPGTPNLGSSPIATANAPGTPDLGNSPVATAGARADGSAAPTTESRREDGPPRSSDPMPPIAVGQPGGPKVAESLAAIADAAPSPSAALKVLVFGSDLQGANASLKLVQARPLGLTGAESATIKAGDLDRLAAHSGVTYIAPDFPVLPQAGPTGDRVPVSFSALATLYPLLDGAHRAWQRGLTGAGIGIAVIDSGAAPAPDFGRRLVRVKLPGGRASALGDSYGHGTLVAGVAAGRSSDGRHVGIAPGARVVAVNIARPDGVHTSDVIAGLAWVAEHQRQYNIRVVGLSLSETAPSSYQTSALDAVVEALWRRGIVVVASAGNLGPGSTRFAPGNDPFVITVGALDPKDTLSTDDDTVASFSSSGRTLDGFAKPDLLAPGRHIVSLLPAATTLGRQAPAANRVAPGYAMISGTSLSAPQVAGAAAILLQKHPRWTPDQVKWVLTHRARTVGGASAGALDLAAAVAFGKRPGLANRGIAASFSSPGNAAPVDAAALSSAAWNSAAWNSAAWNSAAWNSAAWNSAAWNSAAWN